MLILLFIFDSYVIFTVVFIGKKHDFFHQVGYFIEFAFICSVI